MSRPLAWVLSLAIAGILALIVFVSRSAPEIAPPMSDSTADAAAGAREQVELVGGPERIAPLPEPERQPIASQPEQLAQNGYDFIEPPISDQLDGVIEVRVVRAEDGKPILNAQVELEFGASGFEMIRARPPSGSERFRPLVASDGTFRCTGLARGNWTVTATSPGRKSGSEPAKADGETPAAVTVALEMQRDVRVRLVDSSGQLATAESLGVDKWMIGQLNVGVGVACTGAGTTFQHLGGLTYHAKGGGYLSWNLEIFGGGPACVHVLRGDTVLSSRELLPGEREVDLLVTQQDLLRDTASCALQLVDDVHGGPIADVPVKFLPSLGAPREARTDFDGRAIAGPLPAGPITLEVRTPGYMPLRQVVELPLREPLVIRLGAGRRIEGIVLDLYGVPIENVLVSVMTESEARTALGQSIQTRATSGPDGRFAVDSLPRDTHVVRALPRLRRSSSEPRVVDPALVAAEPVISQRVDLRDGDSHAVVLRVNRYSF